MTDTPADDALRAAVERVERALSRFEATRIADLDWPTKVSVEPADLRLILSALTAIAKAGFAVVPVTPTEAMLEAGANRWDTHDPGAGSNYANERATWAAMIAAGGVG